ncbi:SCO6745 family protein [Streptomyces tremellae]|uniref:SalK n=1 Tax=Streptomyces tremellae TaxID=1124239 RepID=A0ABP7DS22_9ACTN
MTTITAREARRCYNAHHPLHAAYYFAPEHDDLYAGLGLERGPMSYLAGRAAPLGPCTAGVVTAVFYTFHPGLVRKLLPPAWRTATPERILDTRLKIVDACLTRLLGAEAVASREMAEAAELALRAAEACTQHGRPLYGANAGLPVPAAAHLAFWHATTLLREHRGDGHVSTLVSAELTGLEALVTHTATGTNWRPAFLRRTRGWAEAEWIDARRSLHERGLLTPAGALTPQGADLRRAVEADTDRLDVAPYRHLGTAGTARLTQLAGAFSRTVLAGGGLPLQDIGRL